MRVLLAIALAACDPTIGVDFPVDATDEDTKVDTEVEDLLEEEPEPPCIYPEGPYLFTAVGDTVAPMSWPDAVARPDEGTAPADLEEFYCDEDVHSIFIMTALTT
jgi:hypothetical protein